MNIIKFLDEFTTESLSAKKSSIRDIFGTFRSLGKKAALAVFPFGALQLALTLEYLEAEFYIMALESVVLPVGKPESIYM